MVIKQTSVVVEPPSPVAHREDGRTAIGEAIRSLRKEKRLSQEELAHIASVDRTTIARVEGGVFKSLSVEKLEAIAAAIGTDLKSLLLKADSAEEKLAFCGQLNRIEFSLDYPQDGFRIDSPMPRQKEFFLGKIAIQPQKTIPWAKLPHPDQIYIHLLEGKMLLTRQAQQCLLKPGDCFTFAGKMDYEFYNPDPFKTCVTLLITHPSFLNE